MRQFDCPPGPLGSIGAVVLRAFIPTVFLASPHLGESPCSIADLILWQRSQSAFSIISARPFLARPCSSRQSMGSAGGAQLAFVSLV